jgi:Cu(I)/Ag(I) efflux system periplasmic protein CusF
MRVQLLTLTAVLTLAAAGTAAAQPAAKPTADMPGMSMPASAAKTGKGTGVITEIDAKGGGLTIKHAAIASLGWPAMTMSFNASPPSLLNGLKVGQKIGFDAKQGSGLPEITAIRKP